MEYRWNTVIADEVIDTSNKEKLRPVLRYVDADTVLLQGTRTGAAAIITCHFEQALYLHSASHCLNLVVMTSLQDTLIMGVDRAVEYFGGHIKRQRAMEKAISDTQPQSTKNKLHGLCRTRWPEGRSQGRGVCSTLGVTPYLPMRCGRQEHCNNMPADDPSVYYRVSPCQWSIISYQNCIQSSA
ncbi:hypothetical protein LSAT2_020441, partial [Lamellibrachia satsuma]